MVELRPSIFHEGWLTYLKKLGTLADHYTWTAAVSHAVLSDPPEPYSPMILSCVNEEGYGNHPAEEAAEGEDEVGEAGAKDELRAGVEGNGAVDQDSP